MRSKLSIRLQDAWPSPGSGLSGLTGLPEIPSSLEIALFQPGDSELGLWLDPMLNFESDSWAAPTILDDLV